MTAISPPPPYSSAPEPPVSPHVPNTIRERRVSHESAETPLDEKYELYAREVHHISTSEEWFDILCCCCQFFECFVNRHETENANFDRSIAISNIPGAIKAIREGAVNYASTDTVIDLAKKRKWNTISFLMGQASTFCLVRKIHRALMCDDKGKQLTYESALTYADNPAWSIAAAYKILKFNSNTKELADKILTIYQDYVKCGYFKYYDHGWNCVRNPPPEPTY